MAELALRRSVGDLSSGTRVQQRDIRREGTNLTVIVEVCGTDRKLEVSSNDLVDLRSRSEVVPLYNRAARRKIDVATNKLIDSMFGKAGS